ncbi:MAG TPA: thermonuclease family protein [Sphingopyxis sp.]|nr:thermonuclease family protein [Sphingopyxis sp.]
MPLSIVTHMRWRRRLRSLAALLLLAGLAVAVWTSQPPAVTVAPLVRVIDGDSLSVQQEGSGALTIRLTGIDAVEYRQDCAHADGSRWPCGHDARSALERLAGRGPLHCDYAAKDRYGRTLASCRTQSGPGAVDLGAEMVRQGWAVATGDAYAFEAAEAEAKRRGIWQGRFDTPADWRATHDRPASAITLPGA